MADELPVTGGAGVIASLPLSAGLGGAIPFPTTGGEGQWDFSTEENSGQYLTVGF